MAFGRRRPLTNARVLRVRCWEFALKLEAMQKLPDDVRAVVTEWREVALSL